MLPSAKGNPDIDRFWGKEKRRHCNQNKMRLYWRNITGLQITMFIFQNLASYCTLTTTKDYRAALCTAKKRRKNYIHISSCYICLIESPRSTLQSVYTVCIQLHALSSHGCFGREGVVVL